MAADPVVSYMSVSELENQVTNLRRQMVEAAKQMEFIEAARLRDEIVKMEQYIATKKEQ